MQIEFDTRDSEILAERQAKWERRPGPRVGDWLELLDGSYKRFTHDWGDGIQVTSSVTGDGSFYFAPGGYMDYSGGLDPAISKSAIEATGKTRNGDAWFFHHNHSGAGRGVHFTTSCRVYRLRK